MAAAGARLVGDYRGVLGDRIVEAAACPAALLADAAAPARRSRAIARPDVFVAIDFPDFNFRLLPRCAGLGIPIVYYVSPQLWAWRAGRIETIKKYVRKMLVIFPFEADMYKKAGVPVEFVGHPLVDLACPTRTGSTCSLAAGLDPHRPVVALLPGSRRNEVQPDPADARRGRATRSPPECRACSSSSRGRRRLTTTCSRPSNGCVKPAFRVAMLSEAADDVLSASDVVVTASGTATVQTALHGKPMVIVYRLAPLTYNIARRFVRVHALWHGQSRRRKARRSRADSGSLHGRVGCRRSHAAPDRRRPIRRDATVACRRSRQARRARRLGTRRRRSAHVSRRAGLQSRRPPGLKTRPPVTIHRCDRSSSLLPRSPPPS